MEGPANRTERRCPGCMRAVRADARFCEACGATLERVCTSCGYIASMSARFCGSCGAPLADREAAEPAAIAAPSTAVSERRQLTVMYCDLVGSTSLSERLDPEDLREVMRAYQAMAAAVIECFAGHVAQHLGDGLLVYFGYPQAHEDDAERAVRAGLGIVNGMSELSARLLAQTGAPLSIRIGIHTGVVVVDDVGGGGRHERLALGDTPNVAARLQGLAAANSVVVSARTRQLAGGHFDDDDLGEQPLKGIAEPVRAWRITGVRATASRFDAATSSGLTPLVGRAQEIGLLSDRWQLAREGDGQVVLLSGEPGIGKSRILSALRDQLAVTHAATLQLQCSPFHSNSAFYPLIQLLERVLALAAEVPAVKLEKLENLIVARNGLPPRHAQLLAHLLSLPTADRHPALATTPRRQKEDTLGALVDLTAAIARCEPCLMLFEDVHWADPTSLEFLDLLINRMTDLQLLVILTFRPEFEPTWARHGHVTALALSRFSRAQSAAMVSGLVGGKPLPAGLLEQIVAKTDGVPLFVEELTKSVLEAGSLRDMGDRYEYAGSAESITVPTTLRDSLMARLDRSLPVKEVAQVGSVIGREFSHQLIAAVAQISPSALEAGLASLVEAGLAFRRGTVPDATYTFKHGLVQDTAYHSLLKSKRQQLHRQVAEVLTARFAGEQTTQPELLAHHLTEAGQIDDALLYWQRAGQRAIESSANVEAIGHLKRGLELLKALPITPDRMRHELALQLALGPTLIATIGSATVEVAACYQRAATLARQLQKREQEFAALFGLRASALARGELQNAHTLGRELLDLAGRSSDSGLKLEAHLAVGNTSFQLGAIGAAHEHLTAALALYDPGVHRAHASVYGMDPGMFCLSLMALVLELFGESDKAKQTSDRALALARGLDHAYSVATAANFAAWFYQLRQEPLATHVHATAAAELAARHGFASASALAVIRSGWSLSAQGHDEAGLAELQTGLALWQQIGSVLGRPHFLGLLAEAHGRGGRATEGLVVVAEALREVDQTCERWLESDLYRLRGELTLQATNDTLQAKAQISHAIEIARAQGVKLFERRAESAWASCASEIDDGSC